MVDRLLLIGTAHALGRYSSLPPQYLFYAVELAPHRLILMYQLQVNLIEEVALVNAS